MIIKTIPPLAKTGRTPGWMDLVARTTPGMRDMGMVRVQVSSSARWADADDVTRLIVQVYDRSEVDDDDRPRPHARPLGSAQRIVRSEELHKGVGIDILLLDATSDLVAIAWLEGTPLGFDDDAFEARPFNAHSFGMTLTPPAGEAAIVLNRAAA